MPTGPPPTITTCACIRLATPGPPLSPQTVGHPYQKKNIPDGRFFSRAVLFPHDPLQGRPSPRTTLLKDDSLQGRLSSRCPPSPHPDITPGSRRTDPAPGRNPSYMKTAFPAVPVASRTTPPSPTSPRRPPRHHPEPRKQKDPDPHTAPPDHPERPERPERPTRGRPSTLRHPHNPKNAKGPPPPERRGRGPRHPTPPADPPENHRTTLGPASSTRTGSGTTSVKQPRLAISGCFECLEDLSHFLAPLVGVGAVHPAGCHF